MKRILTIICLIVILLSITSQGTLAYYTVSGQVSNVITSGSVEVKIHEYSASGEAFPEGGMEVMPGDVVSYVVQVENTGNQSCYVRAKLKKGVNDENLTAEDCLKWNINTDEWTYENGFYYYNEPLNEGCITEPLFSEIYVDGKTVDNNYLGKTFTLDMTVYAVQSKYNGETVWDVNVWPGE